jgi:hypothetical protein
VHIYAHPTVDDFVQGIKKIASSDLPNLIDIILVVHTIWTVSTPQ